MSSIEEQFKEAGLIDETEKKLDGHIEIVSNIEALEAESRANVDSQIATAKKYPRNLKSVLENILFLSTQDKDTAENCFYSIKKGDKVVRGASIRLAEIIMNCYGNLRAGAKLIGNDGKMMTIQGFCWDLENNTAVSIELKRRSADNNGRPLRDDLLIMEINAGCSVALRNAVFKVVPLALTKKIQEKIQDVILGKEADFETTRNNTTVLFTVKGITEAQICGLFNKKQFTELTREDVFDLNGMYVAVKEGDTTLANMFGGQRQPASYSSGNSSNSGNKMSRFMGDLPPEIEPDLSQTSTKFEPVDFEKVAEVAVPSIKTVGASFVTTEAPKTEMPTPPIVVKKKGKRPRAKKL